MYAPTAYGTFIVNLCFVEYTGSFFVPISGFQVFTTVCLIFSLMSLNQNSLPIAAFYYAYAIPAVVAIEGALFGWVWHWFRSKMVARQSDEVQPVKTPDDAYQLFKKRYPQLFPLLSLLFVEVAFNTTVGFEYAQAMYLMAFVVVTVTWYIAHYLAEESYYKSYPGHVQEALDCDKWRCIACWFACVWILIETAVFDLVLQNSAGIFFRFVEHVFGILLILLFMSAVMYFVVWNREKSAQQQASSSNTSTLLAKNSIALRSGPLVNRKSIRPLNY